MVPRWKKRKRAPSRAQYSSHRLPHGRVRGVVVDHQHFEVRVVELRRAHPASDAPSPAARCRSARGSRPSAAAMPARCRDRLEAALPAPGPTPSRPVRSCRRAAAAAATPVRPRSTPHIAARRVPRVLAAHRQQHAGERGAETLRERRPATACRAAGCRAGGTAAAAASRTPRPAVAAAPSSGQSGVSSTGAGHRPFRRWRSRSTMPQ